MSKVGGIEMSDCRYINNGKGTNLTIGPGAYISLGEDGTDIMIRGNKKVIAFDTWEDFVNAIDEKQAVYCQYDEENRRIADKSFSVTEKQEYEGNLIVENKEQELYEVTGYDELEDTVFAHCTSEKLAEAAIRKMVEGGWDEDTLRIRKSNLCLNQIILDDVAIDLTKEI